MTATRGGDASLLTVVTVVEETHNAKSVVLRPHPEEADRFRPRPGQFLTLSLGEGSSPVARAYSLSSAPSEEDLRITVKRMPGGYGSNWICDNVQPGGTVLSLPPAGQFGPLDLGSRLLLFAAGSGITPMMSIIKASLQSPTGAVTLVYANSAEAEIIFASELAALREAFPDRLTIIHALSSDQGRITQAEVQAWAQQYGPDEALICGPGEFIVVVRDGLVEAGLAQDRIRREVFDSLSGDPFAERPPAPTPLEGEVGWAKLEVTIGGDTTQLDWPVQVDLVYLLLECGLDVPYSCRSGECGSCVCNVVDGEVRMNDTAALDEADIESGYVLGCQSYPVSDQVRITFT